MTDLAIQVMEDIQMDEDEEPSVVTSATRTRQPSRGRRHSISSPSSALSARHHHPSHHQHHLKSPSSSSPIAPVLSLTSDWSLERARRLRRIGRQRMGNKFSGAIDTTLTPSSASSHQAETPTRHVAAAAASTEKIQDDADITDKENTTQNHVAHHSKHSSHPTTAAASLSSTTSVIVEEKHEVGTTNELIVVSASPSHSNAPSHHHHHHAHDTAPVLNSPIHSISPLARRIKSHFAAQGHGHNSYVIPADICLEKSMTDTTMGHHSSSDSSHHSKHSSTTTTTTTTAALSTSRSHSPTNESEANLFSPAFVRSSSTTTSTDSSTHITTTTTTTTSTSVNSVLERVAAQSALVHTVVEQLKHTPPSGATDSDMSSYRACALNRLSDGDFDPFLFIKHLPPLAQATRSWTQPALPPQVFPAPRLSLALDLDETLVHCSIEPLIHYDLTFQVMFNTQEYCVYVALRPHLYQFLEAIHDCFEVIVFTASQKIYANELLNRLDPHNRLIHHRIFRESTVCVEGNYLKDLTVLGRDLKSTLILDNSVQAFGYQLDNGIPIESWFDDRGDEELMKLLPFLMKLRQVEDVRPILRQTFKLNEFVRKL